MNAPISVRERIKALLRFLCKNSGRILLPVLAVLLGLTNALGLVTESMHHQVTPLSGAALELQNYVEKHSDGTVTLDEDTVAANPAGFTSTQINTLRTNLRHFNDALHRADPFVKKDSTWSRLLSARAGAWQSSYVKCEWWGCVVALNHNQTQQLANALRWSKNGYGIAYSIGLAVTRNDWLSRLFATVVTLGPSYIGGQIAKFDRGGGVYITVSYAVQWPGLTSQ